ncbi:hypothetical protein MIMGU_mgv11b014307mg [Erythranthe guttata]|uniref:Uncharacterized protein n=1 Tax=Erythranthe guttata TaxID=4155 RepID=A0A022QJF4_ERYGU|nr:hypothetical protein MIMGU_mgv11b014307mg [Erythranthe guttata]
MEPEPKLRALLGTSLLINIPYCPDKRWDLLVIYFLNYNFYPFTHFFSFSKSKGNQPPKPAPILILGTADGEQQLGLFLYTAISLKFVAIAMAV